MSSLCGPLMFGKRSFSIATISAVSSIDSVVWVTKARLSGSFGVKVLASSRGLDQRHRAGRQLAERADHFRVMRMADQQDLAAALEMDRRLAVHLGHQRAGRVQREEIAGAGVGRHRFRHAMGRKHHRRVGIVGDFGQFLDENRALGLQAVDDIAVMHDLVADIDRGAVDRQRPFHGVDRPDHAGAEAAGRTKHDFEVWFGLTWERSRDRITPRRRAGNGQFGIRTWDCFRALSRHV